MSRSQRVMLLAVAAVIAVVAAIVIGSSDGEDRGQPGTAAGTEAPMSTQPPTHSSEAPEPAAPRPAAIRVRDGKPVGGVRHLLFASGDRVRFSVSADVADQVHVHGYDASRDVAPGDPARFDFPATLEGIYEVELEHSGVPVAELEVRP